MFYFSIAGIFLGFASCGPDSQFACDGSESSAHCAEQTPDEKAMIAMDEGDFTTAQTILEELIIAEPLAYFRYPRVAAVYAYQGGLDLLKAATTEGGDGDFLEQIGLFLPDPTTVSETVYDGFLARMELAKTTLLRMPASERVSGVNFYGASASFQLTLYSSALSVMLLNQFTPTGDASVDAQRLESLTVDDAVAIISSLRDAAVVSQADDPEATAKIEAVLAEVDDQPGDTEQERLRSYLEARE